ncbi:uncharacterized protein LOC132282770 [Cornus florida]|uniref:uncharacterized protein LOC132282770 n=1 Tax=Cornus florida TaxID=4283 RepID=UPI002898FCCB|nr:uncharacterized protein LOC132282770 [Cornus florida]
MDGDARILTESPSGKECTSNKGLNLEDNGESNSWEKKEKRKKQKRQNPLQINSGTVDCILETRLETIESSNLSSGPKRKRTQMERCPNMSEIEVDITSVQVRSSQTGKRMKEFETYDREKGKVSSSVVNSLESLSVGSSMLNNLEYSSLASSEDSSDEILASVCSKNMLEREVGVVDSTVSTLLQVVEDVSIKKFSGGCSDGAPAYEESKKSLDVEPTYEESKKRIEMATLKLTIDEDSFVNNGSLEENLVETTIFKGDKSFIDASICEQHPNKILEIQYGMENAICSSSHFAAIKDNQRGVEMRASEHIIDEDDFVNNGSELDSLHENSEQGNGGKINIMQNKDKENLVKEDKSFVDASPSDILCKHNVKKVLKIPSEIENAISSPSQQLDAMKDDVLVVSNSLCAIPPERVLACPFKKKLLILDVNGLLADIVSNVPDGYKAHTIIGQKAVFRRPFCDDFLEFCFERFNVGVWSSRTKRNVDMVLEFLMRKTKGKLAFCWDQSHCTDTGYNTVENREKPMLLKELKKLWEKHEPNLPWKRGEYNESNTLLLDDSPYKALCNPLHTAIFPYSYRYKDVKDNSLAPGGDLRVYLEGLSFAENVQKYVEQNPFGQRPITERNLSWSFYLKVIRSVTFQQKINTNSSPRGDSIGRCGTSHV